jgi:hypothetical protein
MIMETTRKRPYTKRKERKPRSRWPVPEGWIDVAEAARRIGRSYNRTLALVQSGDLKGRGEAFPYAGGIRRRWLTTEAWCQEWIRANSPQPLTLADELITIEQAALESGRSRDTLYAAIGANSLPSEMGRIGHYGKEYLLVKRSALNDYIGRRARGRRKGKPKTLSAVSHE